jgi:uncharacterized protein (TIGR02145 family)
MKTNHLKPALVLLFIFTLFACKNPNTVTDFDGNSYQTIKIGNQTWMAENLRTTHFNNGTPIQNCTQNAHWQQTNQAAYCAYNNKSKKEYGYLYNHYCIENANNIAPEGWRIPKENDIRILEAYLNNNTKTGYLLKEKGYKHWLTAHNLELKNTGFNALPGGYRDNKGDFYMLQSNGYIWTQNASVEFYHWSDRIFQAFADVRREPIHQQYGFSIRCIKEE